MYITSILHKLNIKEEESKKVGILLIQSIFIGIFISFYYSFSLSLFLRKFEIERLPEAYIYSGLLGFFASFLFSKAQKIFNGSTVIKGLFFCILFILFSFKLNLYLFGDTKTIVFLIFIFFIPISNLSMVGFGAMTIKFFDLRQGKRLFSIISAGEVISSLIAFISIPILLTIFISENDDISFLLYFAIFGVLLALLFQFFIGKKYHDVFNKTESTVLNISKKISFRKIIKNKYYSLLIILTIVSVLSFMFIDFSFSNVSREKYTNKTSLTTFIGFFFALIKLMEFIFKTFISGRLIEKYGLKFGLGILPIVLIPITLLTLSSLIFNFSESTSFIFIAIAMLFAMVLKKSFENPTFSLLFQPLDSVTKISLQTLVIGKARLFGVILSGVILYFTSSLEHYILIITVFLIISLFLWIFIINKVDLNFKLLISNLLKERKGKSHKRFSEANYLHSFELLRKRGSNLLHKHFTHRLIPGFQQSNLLKINLNSTENIEELMNSKDPENHLIALAKINNNWNDKYVNFVCSSALSNSFMLRKTSIALLSSRKIEKKYIDDYLSSIVNPTWSVYMFFLLNIGYDYFDLIKKIDLTIESNSENVIEKNIKQILIIQILGENSNPVYDKFFLSKIRNPDSEIEKNILKSLSKRKLIYSESENIMIRDKVRQEVKHYCWILASIFDFPNTIQFKKIILLLFSELEESKNRIYLILGLLYDLDVINQIQSALKGNESHEILLAMEMLEEIIDIEIKDFTIPIYDDTLESRAKFELLVKFFPQMKLTPLKRMENIINYDFKRSMNLLRIVTIKNLSQQYEGINNAILSNVFNPNKILKEAAYLSLFKNNKKVYLKYFELEKDIDFKKKLTFITSNQEILSIDEKVELLYKNEFFPYISRLLLFKIAYFSENNLGRSLDEKVLKEKDYVLFLLSGQLKLTTTNKKPLFTRTGGVLGLKTPIYDEHTVRLDSSENLKYLRISAHNFGQILLTEPLLVSTLLNYSPQLRILKRKKTI